MARKTRAAAAAAMAPVKMKGDGVEEEDIDFVDTFKYLGFHFESGGDRWHHVEIRMAMAASAFGRLRHIWADSRLSRRLKLRVYSTYIVSVLTWGLPAWRLGDVERRKLRGWNARLLTRLLGTEYEDFREVVRQQTREPLFDLVAKLRARRLRWLGHTLRLGEESLLRRVLTRGAAPKAGSVLADEALPPHSCRRTRRRRRRRRWLRSAATSSSATPTAAATGTAPAEYGAHRAGACTCWACRRRRCARRCGARS